MKVGRRKLVLLLGLFLLACSGALAQTPKQTAAPALENILTLEAPTARITALQQFLKTNPTGEQAEAAREGVCTSWAQIAETHLGENNIEKALEAFQQGLKALPKQVSDSFFENTLIKMPLAISARGYRNEAVLLARALETRFATDPARLGALGEYFMTIEAGGEAVHALETAVQLAPEDARLHRALGSAYRMGLRLSDAVAEYQQAVGLDAKDKRALYDLANLYRSQGAYEDAVKLYRRQLEIEPKHSPSYKGLALAQLALGQETEAAAALNQARDLRGSADEITQDITLQTQLAFYYLAQGKIKAARQAAENALRVEPRYSWARIAAAEVDLAENKYFEAERHLLAARTYANFPTLAFTLGKLYLAVEDFDGASEHFAQAFSYTPTDKFKTRLGGVRELQADNLQELLEPEHQAAIFLAEPPTSEAQFKIAESLVRVNARLLEEEKLQKPGSRKPRTDVTESYEPSPDAQPAGLEQAARAFVEAEGSRRSFRALYLAQRLAQAGKALNLAAQLAGQALDVAEVATEAEGAVRDYPNYDREGRLRIFRGRAYEARGWALFKAGRNETALSELSEAVKAYGPLPEGKRALWRLATVRETAGDLPTALELYLAAYEPPAKKGSDVNRTVIEVLYKKVHGSLAGLPEKLGQPVSDALIAKAATAPSARAARNERTAATGSSRQTAEPEVKEVAANTQTIRLGLLGIPVSQPQKKHVEPVSLPQKKTVEPEPIAIAVKPLTLPPIRTQRSPAARPVIVTNSELPTSAPTLANTEPPVEAPPAPPVSEPVIVSARITMPPDMITAKVTRTAPVELPDAAAAELLAWPLLPPSANQALPFSGLIPEETEQKPPPVPEEPAIKVHYEEAPALKANQPKTPRPPSTRPRRVSELAPVAAPPPATTPPQPANARPRRVKRR